MRAPSKRALLVLALFGKRPSPWRLDCVSFRRVTRLTLGEVVWQVNRDVTVGDFGITSAISMGTDDLGAAARRRIARAEWPRLRRAIVRAGFEDHCQLDARLAHGLWIRPIAATTDVSAEWAFVQSLRLHQAARGGVLPEREPAPLRPRVEAACEASFAELRTNRTLMAHLNRVVFTLESQEDFANERWRVSRRVAGDSLMLQSVAQFWPQSVDPRRPLRLPGEFSNVARAMRARGYKGAGIEGAFGRWPLGPSSLREEKRFLANLSLAQLSEARGT